MKSHKHTRNFFIWCLILDTPIHNCFGILWNTMLKQISNEYLSLSVPWVWLKSVNNLNGLQGSSTSLREFTDMMEAQDFDNAIFPEAVRERVYTGPPSRRVSFNIPIANDPNSSSEGKFLHLVFPIPSSCTLSMWFLQYICSQYLQEGNP